MSPERRSAIGEVGRPSTRRPKTLIYETPPDPGSARPPAAGYATRSAACPPARASPSSRSLTIGAMTAAWRFVGRVGPLDTHM